MIAVDVSSENARHVKGLFVLAWPFWISSMAMILMTHAEIWILGYLRPPEEVAAFALVARLALLVSFPLIIVNSVLPPIISELYARDDIKKMERMLRGSAGLTLACCASDISAANDPR